MYRCVKLIMTFQLLQCPGPIRLWAQPGDIIFSALNECTLKQLLESIHEANIACSHTMHLCVSVTCVRVLLTRYARPRTDEFGVLVLKYVRLRVVLGTQLSGTKRMAPKSGEGRTCFFSSYSLRSAKKSCSAPALINSNRFRSTGMPLPSGRIGVRPHPREYRGSIYSLISRVLITGGVCLSGGGGSGSGSKDVDVVGSLCSLLAAFLITDDW